MGTQKLFQNANYTNHIYGIVILLLHYIYWNCQNGSFFQGVKNSLKSFINAHLIQVETSNVCMFYPVIFVDKTTLQT